MRGENTPLMPSGDPLQALNEELRKAKEAAERQVLALREASQKFLVTLKPVEKSAEWSREQAERSPSSHQEFIRQAEDDWHAFEKAKGGLSSLLTDRSEEKVTEFFTRMDRQP